MRYNVKHYRVANKGVSNSGARAHLLYMYNVSCKEGSGSMWTGNFAWGVISTTTLDEPGCGPEESWAVSVAAPGYAIATATYHLRP